jgi:hypothetical protein
VAELSERRLSDQCRPTLLGNVEPPTQQAEIKPVMIYDIDNPGAWREASLYVVSGDLSKDRLHRLTS